MNDPLVMSTSDPLLHLRGWRRWLFLSQKAWQYLRRYSREPHYLYLYLSRVLLSNYKESVQFIPEESFLKIAKHRSTIRIGDGEFGMLTSQRSIHFQSAAPELLKQLSQMIREYNDNSPYLLGLNPQIIMPNRVLGPAGFKYLFMPQKLGYRLFFNHHARYCNASYFYFKGTVLPFLKDLSRGKSVILIANQKNITEAKASPIFSESSSVSYIEIPEREAFSELETLITKVKEASDANETILFVSAGPAGKILLYKLSKEGYLGHDIGHGLHFGLTNTDGEKLIGWDSLDKYWTK